VIIVKIELQGNSGCVLEIIQSNKNTNFVRKTSASLEYNSRLEAQIQKQTKFGSLGFNTPAIFDTGIAADGKIYFDMEYIPGLKFSELVENSLQDEHIAELLITLGNISDLDVTLESETSIIEKLNELERIIKTNRQVDLALKHLKNFEWTNVIKSLCHGDLTLENILVGPKGLTLIDFQDVVVESFSQDLSKITFDLEFNWSSRHTQSSVEKIQGMGNRTKLLRMLEKVIVESRDSNFRAEFQNLKLLNILRVMPYARNDLDQLILQKSLDEISQRIGIK
jgi:tRNA A-37 threonylcarbamoyl transferase component Bud32